MDILIIAAALAAVLLVKKPAERKAIDPEKTETKEPEEPRTISVKKLPIIFTPGTKEALEKSFEDRKQAIIDYGKQTTIYTRGSQATERTKPLSTPKEHV